MSDKSNYTWNIGHRIAHWATSEAERPAITVDGKTWTYSELFQVALSIGHHLGDRNPNSDQPITAIVTASTIVPYASILACVLLNHAYVPINLRHPASRNLAVLKKSAATRIVCGQAQMEEVAALLETHNLQNQIKIIAQTEDVESFEGLKHPIFELHDEIDANLLAYILFTSGSTGDPKGVPISLGNLTSYLNAVESLLDIRASDRLSQMFELTFDLSVHDIFVSWINGAHLIVPNRGEETKPAEYIRNHRISCWFSVPSVAYQIRLQEALQPDAFPDLRISMFCGEGLPMALASEWALAAPSSTVENWYGPTETTIACARHILPRPLPMDTDMQSLVPIGKAFPGMTLSIHRADLSPADEGEEGELLLHGSQVSRGYLQDSEKTAKSFVTLPVHNGVYYRTGDRVVRDSAGNCCFLGRVDNQVKIRGYRVELGEIETILRKLADGHNAIALSWPPNASSGTTVVAAIESSEIDDRAILRDARQQLPDYMVPSRIIALKRFPTNASGKADRKAIGSLVAALLTQKKDEIPANMPEQARQLMDAILLVSPTLTFQGILESETLIAAGMDSLSFVSLTAEIERIFERTLDQDAVADLAELSFSDMVHHLASTPAGMAPADMEKPTTLISRLLKRRTSKSTVEQQQLKRVANRSVQFIEKFPAVLDTLDTDFSMAVGSSGTYRSISPQHFEMAAKRHSHTLALLNAGLPAVSCQGLSMICDFIKRNCEERGIRLPFVIYELDPMQVSIIPPKRDIKLGPDHFNGRIKAFEDDAVNQEFVWIPEKKGGWEPKLTSETIKVRPNWQRKRDYRIVRTYLGDMKFEQKQVNHWMRAVETLGQVTDRVYCFIHPLNLDMTDSETRKYRGEHFNHLLNQIGQLDCLTILNWENFELSNEDYLDINHMNPWSGTPKLSGQLADMILGKS